MGDTRVGNTRLGTPDSCHRGFYERTDVRVASRHEIQDNFPTASQHITNVLRVLCTYILLFFR